ncbi:MAG: hypothetical protein BWY61_01187 [Firmicutes bacterium ADurb.Bin354]|nr:MAG: hypothetical protein BWY61_01187 [Firmicutes bacterium ADurb.Bin354]
MLYLTVIGIRKVLDMEELLDLGDTLCRKVNYLILLIEDKVSGLFRLTVGSHHGIHYGIQLVYHLFIRAALHLLCQHVTYFIKLGSLAALSRNDKRCSCFIDKD